MKRLVLLVLLTATVCSTTGCVTDAQKSRAFITRAGTIVLEPPPAGKGETILRIENNDAAEHKLVLLRLEAGVEPTQLPLVDGVLPVGDPGDLEYDGDGYRVVEKLDTMRPYYGGDQRVVKTVHTYLGAGDYVLMSNLPGDFGKGVWTKFSVGAQS